MFRDLMKLHATNRRIAALLLAMLLPFQGFAAGSACPASPILRSAHVAHPALMHCAAQPGHDSPARHHGACCDCSMAAVDQAVLNWIAPRAEAQPLCLAPLRTPLMVCLDRLDRPPRHRPISLV